MPFSVVDRLIAALVARAGWVVCIENVFGISFIKFNIVDLYMLWRLFG